MMEFIATTTKITSASLISPSASAIAAAPNCR